MNLQRLLLATALSSLVILASNLDARANPPSLNTDEQILKNAHLGTDGPNLVKFLLARSLARVENPFRVEQLIKRLGHREFTIRSQASRDLVQLGNLALPALRRAQLDQDPEIAGRATACVRAIEDRSNRTLVLAVVRLSGKHPIDRTVEALIQFLPFAGDEEVANEIWYALDALTIQQGKLDPSVIAALVSESTLRRAVAGYLVARRAKPAERRKVLALLSDADPFVRLRTAQGLLGAGNSHGIPTLIALLDQPLIDIAWQAEELLHWVASGNSPTAAVATSAKDSGRTCRVAWQQWWQRAGPELDLRSTERVLRRPGLLLAFDVNQSQVLLIGCDGTTRWQLTTLEQVMDAQLLPSGRLLTAEEPQRRPARGDVLGSVARERDLHGNILWQCDGPPQPMAVRRLPNGNTLVAGARRIIEITPDKQLSASLAIPEESYQSVFVPTFTWRPDNGRPLVWLNPSQRDARIYASLNPATLKFEDEFFLAERTSLRGILSNGHYFVRTDNDLLEREGERVIWRCPLTSHDATGLCDVLRLRNGDTVLSCPQRTRLRVLTLEPTGHCVSEMSLPLISPSLKKCLDLVDLGFDTGRPAGFDLDTMSARLQGLSSQDPTIRYLCMCTLNDWGPKAVEAIPKLILSLDDPDARVRKEARAALSTMVGVADLPVLLAACQSERATLRASAISLLGKFPARSRDLVPVVLQALQDKSPDVRREAASVAVAFTDHSEQLVPALIQALADPDVVHDEKETSVAGRAASSLAAFDLKSEPAIAPLIARLRSAEPEQRLIILRTLGNLAHRHQRFLPRILPALRQALAEKKHISSRSVAAYYIGMQGAAAACAVPDLLSALQVQDVKDPVLKGELRESIMSALGQIGPAAERAVPVLIGAVKDRHLPHSERIESARALGKIGSAARAAVPALRECMATMENHQVRQAAADAIEQICAQLGEANKPFNYQQQDQHR
jgi:HEAT repeat protein